MRIQRTINAAILLAAVFVSVGCSTLRAPATHDRPVPTEYQITKAKRNHKNLFPYCAVCGVKPTLLPRANEAHHIVPEHVDMTKAADPDNFVTLCRIHHWWVAHLKNWRDWNMNVEESVIALKATLNRTAISGLEEHQ